MIYGHYRRLAIFVLAAVVCLTPLIPAEHWHLDDHNAALTHHRHLDEHDRDEQAALALASASADESTTVLEPTYLRTRVLLLDPLAATLSDHPVPAPLATLTIGHGQRDPRATHDPPLPRRSPRAPPVPTSARS